MSNLYRIVRCLILCSALSVGGEAYTSNKRIDLTAPGKAPAEILDISSDAAQLSGTIKLFLEEAKARIEEGESIPEISIDVHLDDLRPIIYMLETITSSLKPRKIDGTYAAYRIQPIVHDMLGSKSFDEIKRVFKAANFLEIPLLMNAAAREMVIKDKERTQVVVQEYADHPGPEIYLKKHLKLIELEKVGVQREYSIADFIEENSRWVENSIKDLAALRLANKGLTSLHGIELINDESKAKIKAIYLYKNFLLDHEYDPDFPARPFQGLNNLKKLSMHGNQFTNFPANIFQGLKNLEQLFLGNNQFAKFPANIFEGLKNLEQLSLMDNQLTNLPLNIFQGLNNLRDLDLRNNKLIKLPSKMFQGLDNLKELGSSGNRLDFLKRTTLGTFLKLKGINKK